MATLAEFLTDLADNPDKLSAYRDDPEDYVRHADLSEGQKKVLLSGDALRIQHLVEFELDELGADPALIAGPGPLGFVLRRPFGSSP